MNESTEQTINDELNAQIEASVEGSSNPSIGDAVQLFIKHIDSLAETLPVTMIIISAARKVATDKLQEFEQKYCKVEQNGDARSVEIGPDYVGQFNKLFDRREKALLADKMVPRSFVVSLISEYDAFLGRLIRALLLMKPEILNASERNITFSQLLEFATIENAKEYILEKEIEGVLRKSHSEQFDWLENRFNLELRKGLSIWPTFIEVTERRNLFVHSSGIVSSQYLNVCRKHEVRLGQGIQVGNELHVTPVYFKEAHRCIFEIGVKLAHVLWRKLQPDDCEAADDNLIDICYNLLLEGRFKLARILLDFATTVPKKYASEHNRRLLIINRSQAYKWSGDAEMARRILSAEDWSAASDSFKLAEAVLLDEFDKANLIVKRLGSNGDINKTAYREWPLFREYRKTEGFLQVFEEVFHEPLNLVSVKMSEQESASVAEIEENEGTV